jgi:putative heme iron utilization protein
LILGTFILSSGCKKKTESTPCDSKGTLCIENKLDSTITVSIKSTHDQFTIDKDYMHCSILTGEQSYSINVSATGIFKDTSITILSCDKKLLIIQ